MTENAYYVREWSTNMSDNGVVSSIWEDVEQAWLYVARSQFMAAEIVRKDLGTRTEYVHARIERYE